MHAHQSWLYFGRDTKIHPSPIITTSCLYSSNSTIIICEQNPTLDKI